MSCRVEPKGASHVFVVHGSECRTSDQHPTCTYNPRQSTSRKGMMYVIDIELAMGTDWKVCICVCSLSSILRAAAFRLCGSY